MNLLSIIEKAVAEAKVVASAIETGISTAVAIEGVLPLGGAGASKLTLVINTVHAAYAPVYAAIEGFDVTGLENAVKLAVSDFVGIANTFGLFKTAAVAGVAAAKKV